MLIAGKGHEDKQIYKNKVIFTSDKKIIKNIRLKIKSLTKKNKIIYQNKLLLKKIIKKNINVGNFDGLAIDSRMVKKNNLFLTIKGKNNDGNKFISKAIKKGAKYIVSSKVLINIKKKL